MSYPLKQSQTARPLLFMLVDSTDHITGKTGLSPTVTISKNGAAFATPAGTVTELSAGWYKVAGNATDTATLGPLLLHATGTGADPVDVQYEVVAYDPENANSLGLAYLGGDAYSRIGAAGAGLTALGDTRIANLDAAITTRSSHTAANVRTEMDSNSTKLANLDAAVSSRSTYAGGAVASVTGAVGSVTGAVGSVTGAVGSVAGNVSGNVVGNVNGNVVGTVASVTAAVTVGTNNDKTGYTASTVSDKTGYSLATAPPTAAANASAVRTEIATELGRIDVATSTRSSHSVADIWNALTSGLTTISSIGKLFVDNINATIGSRLPTTSYSAPVTPPTASDNATAVWANGTRTLTSGAAPSAAAVADAVWDEVASDHDTAGSMGQKLNAAGAAADPLLNEVPGAYDEGTAGHALGQVQDIADHFAIVPDDVAPVVIAAPDDTNVITGILYTRNGQNERVGGVTIAFSLKSVTDATGDSYSTVPFSVTSDDTTGDTLGLVTVDLIRGATYSAWRGRATDKPRNVTVPTEGDSFELPDVLGTP